MIPILLSANTIERLLDGATLLIYHIDENDIDLVRNYYENNPEITHYLHNDYNNTLLKECCEFTDNTKYFVQEDFYEKDITPLYPFYVEQEDEFENYYRNNYNETDKYLNDIFPKEEDLLSKISWEEASEMQEHQSRFKFKVISSEVKQYKQLTMTDVIDLGLCASNKFKDEGWEYVDKLLGFKGNPTFILTRIEKI